MSCVSPPDAPASFICLQKVSIPLRIMGLKYVKSIMGAFILGATVLSMLMTASSVVPFMSARVAAVWMTAPSARGS